MSWFFDKAENVDRLRTELLSWVGTGFRQNACRKGVCVDCVQFVQSALQAVGAVAPMAFPAYTVYHGGAEMLPLVLGNLKAQSLAQVWAAKVSVPVRQAGCCGDEGETVLVEQPNTEPASLMAGDVVFFSSGKAWHHLAIFDAWPRVWHAVDKVPIVFDGRTRFGGVTTGNLADPMLAKRIHSVWRCPA